MTTGNKYVTTRKLQDMYGFTRSAIDNKVSTRNWLENVHFVKRSNRRFWIISEIDNWIDGKKPSKKAQEALKKASQAAYKL